MKSARVRRGRQRRVEDSIIILDESLLKGGARTNTQKMATAWGCTESFWRGSDDLLILTVDGSLVLLLMVYVTQHINDIHDNTNLCG
jgi:hypothetical protein